MRSYSEAIFVSVGINRKNDKLGYAGVGIEVNNSHCDNLRYFIYIYCKLEFNLSFKPQFIHRTRHKNAADER